MRGREDNYPLGSGVIYYTFQRGPMHYSPVHINDFRKKAKRRSLIIKHFSFLAITVFLIFIIPSQGNGQDTTKVIPDGTDGLTHKVHSVDSATGLAKNLGANEFDGPYSSFKIGLGFIQDFTAYSESEVFKQQMDSAGFNLTPKFKVRDFRILGSGVLKTKRPISWKFAYMYDGNLGSWLVRESGVNIGVPELAGNIFIGRTKEGLSMVKVMNGHSPWTMERQMALDVIPILADGIKYMGFLPKSRVFWNLGAFNDVVSKGQGFSTYAWQYVARVGWLPIYDKQNNIVLHIGTNLRYGRPVDGKIALKSRPESNPTPQILNTGSFAADHSSHIGYEIYYRNKNVMIGSEALRHKFYSEKSGDHTFYGGDVVLSYFFTGAIRPYNTSSSIFGFIPVKKSVFKGGWGEWEGVLRFSYLDLNDPADGPIQGGSFWRLTPMVNWYFSKVIRLEFVYGYGVFDRYNLKGNVQFFESRIQFTVM